MERRDEHEILRSIALYIVRKQIHFVLNHRHKNDLKYIPPYEVEIHKATGIHRTTVRKYLQGLTDRHIFVKYSKLWEDIPHNEVYYGIKPRQKPGVPKIQEKEYPPDAAKLGALYYLESELQLPFPFARLNPDYLEHSLPSLTRLKNAIVSLRQAPNKPLPV